MKDITFGSLNKRQLHLRVFSSSQFERWTGEKIVFAPLRLFNPLCWTKAIVRGDYRFWWNYHPNCNHRCWCQEGTMLDFSLVAAGFGLIVFYSRYGGAVPCTCDKIIKELFGDDEDDEA